MIDSVTRAYSFGRRGNERKFSKLILRFPKPSREFVKKKECEIENPNLRALSLALQITMQEASQILAVIQECQGERSIL